MKFLRNFTLFCFLILSQLSFAGNYEGILAVSKDLNVSQKGCGNSRPCCNTCNLGSASFSGGPPDWFVIQTPTYPEFVLLSANRNVGSTQGNVKLTPTGLKINKSGNYSVSFSAILLNNNPAYTPLLPVFVIRNGIFDPTDTLILGGVVSLPNGLFETVQGTGILENVKAGTTLSIIATNGGSPEPEPVTVIAWGISAYRIPCDPVKSSN